MFQANFDALGRKYKTDGKITDYEDLLYLLKNKYHNLDLNKSHISRIIHDNNITLKMTRIRDEPVLNEKR